MSRSLEAEKMMAIDFVKIEASEIVETGEYDLEGLFVRLGYAIDSIGAKRVVLDTIESIFSAFGNTLIIRSELRRLFQFLKEKGVTAVITGEKGEGTFTGTDWKNTSPMRSWSLTTASLATWPPGECAY